MAAQVLLHLITTKDKGINYHRVQTRSNLPPCPDLRLSEPHEEPFPISTPSLQLAGTVDASFTPDIEQRKSITGYTFFLAQAAIYYKCELQTSVVTSATESEFVAAATSSKTALYLRSILHDLGISQTSCTLIYVDNVAATHMANHSCPTPRTRHIDIS